MKKLRLGSIVKCIASRSKNYNKVGMINYRKGNSYIGVNFGHYQMIKVTQKDKTDDQILEQLKFLGIDEMFEKDELEII